MVKTFETSLYGLESNIISLLANSSRRGGECINDGTEHSRYILSRNLIKQLILREEFEHGNKISGGLEKLENRDKIDNQKIHIYN